MPGFVTCGPNESLIISGCCHSKPHLMPGGRVFVWPWFQKIQRISLNTMTLTIESPNVYTKNGVPISLTGISQVKISGNNADKLLAASENFLGKTESEIIKIVQETLEGHQREVMAKMTVEKIYVDRKDFSKQVYQIASSDLADMGLVVVSYTVKDIHDDQGYLEALGLAQTAKVKIDAKIGEIEEFKERKIKELNADKEHFLAKYRNDQQIAKAEHEFNLKKAEFDISISKEKAKSDLADELQKELGHIELIKENALIEKEQEFKFDEIAAKKKEIKETELLMRIKKRADSELKKTEIISKAEKAKIEKEADTEAEVIKLIGKANNYYAEQLAKAQTETMALEASAYSDFNSAAKINMLLETLPRVAGEVCNPVSECNKITMVSQGDGEVGVNKMVTEFMNIINQVYTSVGQLSNMASSATYPDDAPPNQPPAVPGVLASKSSYSSKTSYSFLK